MLPPLCVVLDARLIDPKYRKTRSPNQKATGITVLLFHEDLTSLDVLLQPWPGKKANFLVVLPGKILNVFQGYCPLVSSTHVDLR
jgi:hypothetical protein